MGTKTYELTDYINEIESCYKKARLEFEEAVARLNNLDANHKKLIDRKELNNNGIQRENERYNKRKMELLEIIRTARNTFLNNANEIRNSVEVLFKDNYKLDPNDIDMKAVEMLKSGMLTERELLGMAYKYKAEHNHAMYRYCGTFANTNDSDPDLKHLAFDSRRPVQRDDLMIVDNFTDLCAKGLRDDVVLSNGVDSRHDEFLEGTLSHSKNIRVTTKVPWITE